MSDILKTYLTSRADEYFKRFWANTAYQNGLTIKFDGKLLLVKPQDIHVIDLGSMCGNCLCGHAIRYEFWFDEVGPIGSTCIKVMTGLSGTDLRLLLKAVDLAKQDRKDLEDTIEVVKTFENQIENHVGIKQNIEKLKQASKLPLIIEQFKNENIPLPHSLIRILNDAVWELDREQDYKNRYGEETYDLMKTQQEILKTMEQMCPALKDHIEGGNYVGDVIEDIYRALINRKASVAQQAFFVKLVKRLQNPKMLDALNVLFVLSKSPIEDFWLKIIDENLKSAATYGLSDKQIDFILEKSSSGKPGLAVRFTNFLENKKEDE